MILAPQLSQLSVRLSTTVKDNTLQVWKGKHIMYPTAVVLATTPGSFGQISASHSFTKEPTFENTSVLLLLPKGPC